MFTTCSHKTFRIFSTILLIGNLFFTQGAYAARPDNAGRPIDVGNSTKEHSQEQTNGHSSTNAQTPPTPGLPSSPPTDTPPTEPPIETSSPEELPPQEKPPTDPEPSEVKGEADASEQKQNKQETSPESSPTASATPTATADFRFDVTHFGIEQQANYSEVDEQPTAPGSLTNGAIGPFIEGACIPAIIEVENRGRGMGDLDLSLLFDYRRTAGQDTQVSIENLEEIHFARSVDVTDLRQTIDNLNDFTYVNSSLSAASSFPTDSVDTPRVTASVTGPFGSTTGTQDPSSNDDSRHYNIHLSAVPAHTTVHLLFCARLGSQASQVPESQIRMESEAGNVGVLLINGNQLTPAHTGLTLRKIVSGGEATSDQWSFDISPAIGDVTRFSIPKGRDLINIPAAEEGVTYTIREIGPDHYTFLSGAGTNCSFSEGIASALIPVERGRSKGSAQCTFTNIYTAPTTTPPGETTVTTGTLQVATTVINDNGGTAVASDFTQHVSGTNVSISDFNGSAIGVNVILDAGNYTVTQMASSSYTTTYSGNCAGILAAGSSTVCTIVNNDIATTTSTPGENGGGSSTTTSTPPTTTSTNNGTGTETTGGNTGGSSVGGSGVGGVNTNLNGGGALTGSGGGSILNVGSLGSTAPLIFPEPTPRVLGDTDINVAAGACELILPEVLQITPNVNDITNYFGIARKMSLEKTYAKSLVTRVTPSELTAEQRASVLHFTTYGTPKTYHLGAGERAGVINSFRAIYNRLPSSDCDWQNVILMSNTLLPLTLQPSRETEAEKIFAQVYATIIDRSMIEETKAFNHISYGLRPTMRNLTAERKAIPVFRKLFNKLPKTATEWDTVRALAYTKLHAKTVK